MCLSAGQLHVRDLRAPRHYVAIEASLGQDGTRKVQWFGFANVFEPVTLKETGNGRVYHGRL
jgi:hypothetical protein